jgi:hypothetical protein
VEASSRGPGDGDHIDHFIGDFGFQMNELSMSLADVLVGICVAWNRASETHIWPQKLADTTPLDGAENHSGYRKLLL